MTKFEIPLIKFMVTADGPACFDISNEINKVAEQLNKGLCECLCTCPNKPINTHCLCEGPCHCMCTCKCECLGQCACLTTCNCLCECPCPCILPSHDSRSQTDNVSAVDIQIPVNAKTVVFGSQFMLRRESFGGLLFNKESFSSYLCNHTAFEILRFIENQRDGFFMAKSSELVDYLRNIFNDVPNNTEIVVLAFICACTKQNFVEVI